MITKVSSLSLNCAGQNFPMVTNRQPESFRGQEFSGEIQEEEAQKTRNNALLLSLATVGAAFCSTLGYLLFVGCRAKA